MGAVISIRPPPDLLQKIDTLSELTSLDRTSLIKMVLHSGLNEELKKYALEKYQDGRISIGKAAELSGISIREMIEYVKLKNINLNLSVREIQDDFEAAMRL
jgi:predicted HTH domain antitoxin